MRLIQILCAGLGLFLVQARSAPGNLEQLATFMTGAFSNAEQARNDTSFRDSVLHIAPIWSNRTDGPWLYGEQALADAPQHPYRQFVYQLAARTDGDLEIRLFDLPDLLAATGAWKDPARLAGLTPAQLSPRTGCTLVLHLQDDGSFKGATAGRGCAGADVDYSTIEATVSNQQVIIWERGYNASGVQIRGSIHGGYAFKKAE